MATLKLVVRPDGRAILTSSAPLSSYAREHLLRALSEWRTGTHIVVLDDCEVVQVSDVEIDLGEPAAVAI